MQTVATQAGSEPWRVTKIEVIRVALPFDAGRRARGGSAPNAAPKDAFNAASRTLQRMETLLVKVSTDSGHVGWGEAFGHLINPVTFAALAGPVGRFFIGTAIGPDPDSFAEKIDAARQAFHPFGRTGPVVFALSAIDTALWDLCAQAADVPLYRLLGGAHPSRESVTEDGVLAQVDVYASLVSYDNDPEEVVYQVQRAQAAGFRRMKLHETQRDAIAAARQALPAHLGLMVDVNCPWPHAEAKVRVAELTELGLGWVEEPVWPPDDIDALADVRAQGVPIAAGENASGVAGFAQHFARRALDVAQPSVAKIGGITAMREVIALAQTHQVRVVPHCFYYGAGLLATAHLVATLPSDVALEVPWLQWPIPLYAQQVFGPVFALPQVPGLGFVPDAAVLAAHTIDRAQVA